MTITTNLFKNLRFNTRNNHFDLSWLFILIATTIRHRFHFDIARILEVINSRRSIIRYSLASQRRRVWSCNSVKDCGADAFAVASRHGERGACGGAAPRWQEDAEEAGAGRAGRGRRRPRGPAAVGLQRRGRALGPPQLPPPPLAPLPSPRRRLSPMRVRRLRCHRAVALRRCSAADSLASNRNG